MKAGMVASVARHVFYCFVIQQLPIVLILLDMYYQLKHLYVAITRARQNLWITDCSQKAEPIRVGYMCTLPRRMAHADTNLVAFVERDRCHSRAHARYTYP